MKLRIRGNSVRIRVTRSEVARLGQGSSVEQIIQFSPQRVLRSSVQSCPSVATPTAEFDGTGVFVRLPQEQVRQWASSDQVTIEAVQRVTSDTMLQILVEKDFECIHSKREGNTDAFPNPREQREACADHAHA